MRLSKKQKQLAMICGPKHGYNVSKTEIKQAKIAAAGHYWNHDDCTYVSFGQNGKLQSFDISCPEIKCCAFLWSKGRYSAAIKLYNELWDL